MRISRSPGGVPTTIFFLLYRFFKPLKIALKFGCTPALTDLTFRVSCPKISKSTTEAIKEATEIMRKGTKLLKEKVPMYLRKRRSLETKQKREVQGKILIRLKQKDNLKRYKLLVQFAFHRLLLLLCNK